MTSNKIHFKMILTQKNAKFADQPKEREIKQK